MSIEDEVNKLNIDIREIDEWLGCQHVVQAGNQAWCHDNFEVVLNSYVATRRIAKQYGVEIPPVDYEGLTEVEILTKCLVQTEEIQSLRLILHQKASVLGAELRVKNVFSRQIDELDEDTDFLALRSEDRTIVVGLIAKIRLEVTNAEWMEDKHRVRVLKKISGVEGLCCTNILRGFIL